MSVNRPLGELDCMELNLTPGGTPCRYAQIGFDRAQDVAYLQGLFDTAETPAFSFLSLSDAQTLLPAITLVLATAFGARLIIQLVKG